MTVRINKELLHDIKDVTQKLDEVHKELMSVIERTNNYVNENNLSFNDIHKEDLKIIEKLENVFLKSLIFKR